ncbi:glycerophosphodiester phosphodiesterase family protein [Aurantimicrobium minutum]|uniref:glycerophosphodiester phosphodiesterase n=1 Tax=Aurantimicrobium minutum TaxID=708131 RepID=A0A173LZ13_9MICO|nr:glycerophosphodiester phosphodiesterase family protein [Aurantimicrobium minutum]BAV00095.1 Bax protein [Aurantimicrobium minutum]
MTSPLVIAHRGASGYHPEHTRKAYLTAIEQGADAIEPDLVISRDGVLVIRHENEISGTTDVASRPEFAHLLTTKVVDGEELTGWFTEDFTWAELSTLRCIERVPQLRPQNALENGEYAMLRFIDLLEIADQAPRKLTLVVEIKHPTYFAQQGFAFEDLIAQDLFLAGWHLNDSRIFIESFEKSVVMRCKDKGVGARHVYIMDFGYTAFDEVQWALSEGVPSISNLDELSNAGLDIFAEKLDGVALAWSLLMGRDSTLDVEQGRRIVESAHQRGLTVWVWSLRIENVFLPEEFRTDGAEHEPGKWEEFFALLWSLGVDGVFSDFPDLAVRTRP